MQIFSVKPVKTGSSVGFGVDHPYYLRDFSPGKLVAQVIWYKGCPVRTPSSVTLLTSSTDGPSLRYGREGNLHLYSIAEKNIPLNQICSNICSPSNARKRIEITWKDAKGKQKVIQLSWTQGKLLMIQRRAGLNETLQIWLDPFVEMTLCMKEQLSKLTLTTHTRPLLTCFQLPFDFHPQYCEIDYFAPQALFALLLAATASASPISRAKRQSANEVATRFSVIIMIRLMMTWWCSVFDRDFKRWKSMHQGWSHDTDYVTWF